MITRFGFFKVWRRQVWQDMALDAKSFKVWMLLNGLALHSRYGQLHPGDVVISYSDLQVLLREYDSADSFRTYSEHTLKRSLDKLVESGRITRSAKKKGCEMKYSIVDWTPMQRGDWDAVLTANGAGRAPGHGFIKVWRRELGPQLSLDAKTFKALTLLNILAAHSSKHGVEPGAVTASSSDLRAVLGGRSEEPCTDSALTASLDKLSTDGYITRKMDVRGNVQRCTINNWKGMQQGNWDLVIDEDLPPELRSTFRRKR